MPNPPSADNIGSEPVDVGQPVQPRPAAAAAPPTAQGRFIVVFGTKGGVGKTMVAINTAVSLAQRTKKPVCLIDLDVMAMGDMAKALNLQLSGSLADLMPTLKRHLAEDTARTGKSRIAFEQLGVAHSSGVHVVTCLSNPRQISQLDLKVLGVLFQELKQRYDYIVVDGGKGFSELLITAFEAANLIMLVATPDVITLYQTKWAVGMVESLLFPSMMIKAVLNRAESRGSIGTQDVRDVIPCAVIAQIPSDGRTVGTSMNQGVPLTMAFGYSKVAEAFTRLAEALVTNPQLFMGHSDIPRHQHLEEGNGAGAVPAVPDSLVSSARLFAPQEPQQAETTVDEIAVMKARIHKQLVEELDLKRLDMGALANNNQMSELRKKVEPVIANLLAREIGGLISSHEVRARLIKEIVDEALGLGPLEELLDDQSVSDILVNNKDEIYVERHGRLELTTKKFLSNNQIRAIIERIIAPLGRRIDEATPMVDARLPDGSRINAIIPPLSVKGPVLSIRKFARVRYTQEDLLKFNSLNPAMFQFIRACVIARKNMIISGGTGSGKSTLLNIISMFIPPGERIITIEDAAELKLAQPHWVSLEGRPANVEGKGNIGIRDLFTNALRMRPDRIIIGECRGAESLDMLQAMNTGHDGSITTVHANSPKDVIARLDSMVLMSNVDLPIRAIREMVASAIHIIVHTARMSDGSRKITSIVEITGMHDIDVQYQELFVFKQIGVGPGGEVRGQFTATGKKPRCFEEIRVKGIELDEAIFAPAVPAA
jgi:septum site-determining protein MinD